MGKMTEENISWLRANYGKYNRKECAKLLMVHVSTITKFVNLLKLKGNGDGNASAENAPEVEKVIGYCLDCLDYINGGKCKIHRETGALQKKSCFKPIEI